MCMLGLERAGVYLLLVIHAFISHLPEVRQRMVSLSVKWSKQYLACRVI